jgi:hypothetical protein
MAAAKTVKIPEFCNRQKGIFANATSTFIGMAKEAKRPQSVIPGAH